MAARPFDAMFRCRNIDCGCEMTVTRGPKRSLQAGDRTPVCLCGSSMDRIVLPESPALLI
jgi:hypothetical protein